MADSASDSGVVASDPSPSGDESLKDTSYELIPVQRPSLIHQFAADCGSGRLRISSSLTGEDRWTTIDAEGPFAIIGRDECCILPLSDSQVSRKHLYLQVTGGQIAFADLGSRTGIIRAGRRVPSGLLALDETLEIGPFTLRFDVIPVVDAGPTRDDESTSPRIALEFVNHRKCSKLWNVERTVTPIGSTKPCRVRLEHSSVSRVHCAIVQGRSSWWIVDLGSRTGTSVDGVASEFAKLTMGSMLMVGQYRIRIQPPEDSDACDESSIHDDPAPGTSLVAEIARVATNSSHESSRRPHKAVSEELVMDLFREFTAMHERTIMQMQQSFREMLDVAVGPRQINSSVPSAEAPLPSPPAEPAESVIAPPQTVAEHTSQEAPARDRKSTFSHADDRPIEDHRSNESLPAADDGELRTPNAEQVNQAMKSSHAEEREAAHDLLAAQMRALESRLEQDRKGLAKRLMRSLSFLK
jgi:pSer/pThr/pTyr-binding forkhead associated (FHA) protein